MHPVIRLSLTLLALASTVCWAALPAPAGQLRTIGEYPTWRIGHTIAALGQGRYLVHGAQPFDYAPGKPQDNPVLRERSHAATGPQIERDAWLWLPDRKGWKRLPPQPECPINAHLAAITPLANGDTLLTGGLCNPPRMADDTSPTVEFRATSRLNGKTLQWEDSPPLHTSRLFHTATALGDGSVLVVGGQKDPAVSPAPYPVLGSVEWLRDGRFQSAAPLNEARANHSATPLDGNQLLIVGGFDALGAVTASVELWDAREARWQTLPPLRQARYAHSATRLADGRVLVTGGFEATGRALNSTEYFDPRTRTWQSGPSLPAPVGRHRTALLGSGTVLLVGEVTPIPPEIDAIGYFLTPDAQTWQLAARLPADSESDGLPQSGPLIDPLAQGKALIFGKRYIWHWQDLADSPASQPPKWRGSPSLVRTRERQVMLIASSAESDSPTRLAWVGDIDSQQWRPAGRLKNAYRGPSRAIRLDSGRILFLAHAANNTLVCELSQAIPDNSEWADCGSLSAEFVLESGVVMANLPDGRIIALPNQSEGFIYDPGRNQWRRGTLVWHTKTQNFGTPVRPDGPLTELQLSGDGALPAETIDVSPSGARLWGYVGARRDHAIVISGHVTREVSGRGESPALLWNEEKGYWDYVFRDHYGIGRDALRLPDGCAMSFQPTSLFDPRTGKAERRSPPGGLNESNNSSVVLNDGTVIIASAENGGGDSLLLIRKASCDGLASTDGIPEMPGVLIKDLPPPPLTTSPVPAAPEPSAVGMSGKIRDFFARLPNFSELPPISQAALVLFGLLGFIRWGLLPRLKTRSKAKADALQSKSATLPVAVDSPGDRLHKTVPSRIQRGLRILFYTIASILVVPPLVGYLNFSRMQTAIQPCYEDARACLDPQSGILKSIPTLGGKQIKADERAHLPCRFIGNWSSRQGYQIRRITLKDDGTYQMNPLVQGGDRQNGYQGYWMTQAGHMVWRNQSGLGELDINQIAEEGDGWFTVIEGNGARTRFERMDTHISNRCLP